MTAPGTPVSGQEIRRLHQSLTGARDEQISRVVAMVDGMSRRDEADKLIAPLRPRLAQLRPPRPLTFCRLMFTPLDPVIVPATEWRRGAASIPRTALAALAAQIRDSLTPDQTKLACALLESRFVDDPAAISEAGAIVWPAGAALLRRAAAPPGWTDATGLAVSDHAVLARAVATVLDVARDIQTMVERAEGGEEIETDPLLATLRTAGGAGPDGLALLLSVLMHRLPPLPSLLSVTAEIASAQPVVAGGAALERAVDFVIASFGAPTLLTLDLRGTALQVARAATVLDGIEAPGPTHRPSRKGQAEQLRREIDRTCRQRFAAELEARVVARAATLDAAASDEEVAALEAAARELRAFEDAGRRIGGGADYDQLLRAAAGSVSSGVAAPLPDRIRLVEILLGSDAALEQLARPTAARPAPA